MLFNSFSFFVFLPIVFAIYWSLGRRLWLQNLLLLSASYLFYGWWDWRFLFLIVFTSLWSYLTGLAELRRWGSRPSRTLLVMSLIVNLGILGAFKYYDFFVGEFSALLSCFGFNVTAPILDVLLPVGISFYTFQALSYTIDVYRRQVRPVSDAVAFFAFIGFFPQLVAGPIERASNLLPQFIRSRRFDYPSAVLGCRQMLWGFFKKMVVADNCAVVANFLLDESSQSNGLAIWLGVFMFAIQIYGDFSGYSDIAIGCSKLFGIDLMRNFAFPYFSRDIAEFWRRWHISLTTWFRDYLYIPLGGSRCGNMLRLRNIFIVFLVSGLWHGANWTFVFWGAFHAALFVPLMLTGRNRRHLVGNRIPELGDLGRMLLTFALVVIGWAFFRAESARECGIWLCNMFNPESWRALAERPEKLNISLFAIFLMLAVEWWNRSMVFGFSRLPENAVLRWTVYLATVLLIVVYTPGSEAFVYFQF